METTNVHKLFEPILVGPIEIKKLGEYLRQVAELVCGICVRQPNDRS